MLCQENVNKRRSFTDLIFLKNKTNTICTECMTKFEKVSNSEKSCQRCCKRGTEKICKDCLRWEKEGYIVDHHSLYSYNQQMMEYISRYKFHGDYYLRMVFATELRKALKKWPDYTIVPIPLSDKRYKDRGFNQVIGLLEGAGVPYKSILKKEHSEKQSEKTRQERLATKQSFYIDEGEKIRDKILLVDDIYTTGATLKLARELFVKNDEKIVKTFSLAR